MKKKSNIDIKCSMCCKMKGITFGEIKTEFPLCHNLCFETSIRMWKTKNNNYIVNEENFYNVANRDSSFHW